MLLNQGQTGQKVRTEVDLGKPVSPFLLTRAIYVPHKRSSALKRKEIGVDGLLNFKKKRTEIWKGKEEVSLRGS